MGPWVLVSAEGNLRQERRLIDTDYRHGEGFVDAVGSVVRIREKQHRFEVLFFWGGGANKTPILFGKLFFKRCAGCGGRKFRWPHGGDHIGPSEHSGASRSTATATVPSLAIATLPSDRERCRSWRATRSISSRSGNTMTPRSSLVFEGP